YVGDPGSGCSDNQYQQFNVNSVTGPGYNSVGLESGRNILRGCFINQVDMALAKNIHVGGQRNVQLRVDVFNLFNTYNITARNSTVQFVSPTNLTVLNSEYN